MAETLPKRNSITESPWYWAYVFATAGLIALVLMGPKFGPRQSQIERKYQGREIAMTPESQRDAAVELSTGDNTLISLTPFYIVLTGVFIVAWIMLWRRHFRKPRAPAAMNKSAT